MANQKTLLLIDSYALIFRAFYAFPPTLTAGDGTPINSVYGFTSLLLDVLLKFKPTHVVAIMDSDKPTIRSSEYTQYKAHRKETPSEFIVQIPKVFELLQAFDIPILKVDGYEADDVIATIDNNHSGKWAQTIIVTGDRDLFQLVDDDTFVYLAGSSFSQSKLFNAQMVKEKMGVTPSQITDYKGLSGDASDNIPGVAGIGDKSAIDLISQFQSLENIYQNINQVSTRYQNKLVNNYEVAIMSKKLATVVKEVPLNFEFETCVFPTFKLGILTSMFENLRFKSLATKLEKLVKEYSYADVEESGQDTLFDLNDSNEVLRFDFAQLNAEDVYLYSEFVEWKSPLHYNQAKIYMKQGENHGIVQFENLDKIANIAKLNKLYLFDAKKLIHFFKNIDLELNNDNLIDLGIHGVLEAEGQAIYSLKSLFGHYEVKYTPKAESMLLGLENLKSKLKLNHNLYQIEKDVLSCVIEMEREGISLDKNELEKDTGTIIKSISDVKVAIVKEVGHDFNINSPKQLSEILFKERGLKPLKKTKGGGLSTNESTLVKMEGQDPLIPLILKYRELEKIRSTYLESLPQYIEPLTNKIHSSFDQFGAISGRFSSKNPNMQNMPKGEIDGINIRNLFIASKEKIFIGVDYSQQELRILAALAKEGTMLEAFNSEKDIHKITASEIFAKPIDAITKEERNVGKTINFSVIYGISPFALSERLKIERSTAAEFINKYYLKYPLIKLFMDNTLALARSVGYTETIMGRKRVELNINSSNIPLRAAAERELFNFVIQGSAADLMKMCMSSFGTILSKYNAKLLLQVHDEFLFELNEKSNLNGFVVELRAIMLNIKDIGVKYDVDVKYGKRWGAMSEFQV